MEAAEEGHHRAAHHHVVEVRHDEVRVVEMDVHREGAQVDAGQAADVKRIRNEIA